jgi:hypothetical protein
VNGAAVPPAPPVPSVPARAASLVVLLAAATALAVLVLEPPCFWRAMTGVDCPTCGATRAARALLAGRPAEAFGHHAPTVLAAIQFAVLALGAAALRMAGRPLRRPPQRVVDIALATNVLLLLTAWGVRLVAGR